MTRAVKSCGSFVAIAMLRIGEGRQKSSTVKAERGLRSDVVVLRGRMIRADDSGAGSGKGHAIAD